MNIFTSLSRSAKTRVQRAVELPDGSIGVATLSLTGAAPAGLDDSSIADAIRAKGAEVTLQVTDGRTLKEHGEARRVQEKGMGVEAARLAGAFFGRTIPAPSNVLTGAES